MSIARIRGSAEIVLNVRDIARMRQFYVDALGFTFHSEIPDDDPTIVFLTICDRGTPLAGGGHPEMLVLIDPARHPHAMGLFDVVEKRRSTLNHLAFEIDECDYKPALEGLDRLGLVYETERFGFLQAKAVFFDDPEGNLLELICHDADSSGSVK